MKKALIKNLKDDIYCRIKPLKNMKDIPKNVIFQY